MSANIKVDFNAVLKDLDGKDLKERIGAQQVGAMLVEAGISPMLIDQALGVLRPFWSSGEPKETTMTACRACANALQFQDASVLGAERVDRMRLAIKIMDPKQPVEITEKERATIMSCVEKTYPGPIIYFRIDGLFKASEQKAETGA